MTPQELSKKRCWFFVLVAYFVVGYLGTNYLNLFRDYYYNVALPFEENIPFIPFFITGYTSVYLGLMLVYAVIDDYTVFKRTVTFFLIVSTVHLVIFLLFPVKMVRPDLTNSNGVMNMLTHYYYLIDNPVNCFPSLHVAYPFAGTLVLWNYKRKWGYLLAVMTAFIAVSVVLVKQHYIVDVVAAVVLTGLIYRIAKPIVPPL